MKNRYLTKQQKNDIAVSILYDWSLGQKEYPSALTINARLRVGVISRFIQFDTYQLLRRMRNIMREIVDKHMLLFYFSIDDKLIKAYAKENGLHILPMKVMRYAETKNNKI